MMARGGLPCLFLRDLSPCNPPPLEHLLIVLKGYFDGGNQADSTKYDRVTLATACGTCEEWTALESAWKDVLLFHKSPPLHTTDAIGLYKEFSPEKGWDADKVDSLISDCVGVVEQHLLVTGSLFIPGPYGYRPNVVKPGINMTTLTIPLKDYRLARKIVPGLPNSVTEICTTESLGFCFKWGRIIGAEQLELYFDRGEPFFGHADDRRNNKKSKKQIQLMSKVAVLAKTNIAISPALQVADLFAWCINHVNDVRRGWHERLNAIPHWYSLILDYPRLINPLPWAIRRTASWKLPTRSLEQFQCGCIVDSGETLRQTGNGEIVRGRSAAQAAAGPRPWGRKFGATGPALLGECGLGVEDLRPT
jgi:hypothetical protein